MSNEQKHLKHKDESELRALIQREFPPLQNAELPRDLGSGTDPNARAVDAPAHFRSHQIRHAAKGRDLDAEPVC